MLKAQIQQMNVEFEHLAETKTLIDDELKQKPTYTIQQSNDEKERDCQVSYGSNGHSWQQAIILTLEFETLFKKSRLTK